MIIKNATVLNDNFKFVKTDIKVEDGKFAFIGECCEEADLDLSGKYIVPGLIDIHIHGGKGVRFDDSDGTEETVEKITEYLLNNGTTSCAATISSRSFEATVDNINRCKGYVANGQKYARIIGIHMEGPYLSILKKGAGVPKYIRKPDIEEFKKFYEVSEGLIKLIDVAPEVEGGLDFIAQASKMCTVAMGHTDSDYATAMEAIKIGASHVTHTFNAMRSYNHREPNLLGAAFDTDVICECISDGIHLSPTTVRMLYKLVGSERLVLISDTCMQAGLPDGQYMSTKEGHKITVTNGLAVNADGTICGGCYPLLYSVQKAIEFGIPADEAFKCASIIPARVMKADNELGSIKEGKIADFLVLDENYKLCDVYKNGERFCTAE